MRSSPLLGLLSLLGVTGCPNGGAGLKVHNDDPTANITGPDDGAEVLEGAAVTLSGSVDDDKGIDKLEWRVNGEVICDLASAPPAEDGGTSCAWTVDASAEVTLWVEDTQGADAEDSTSIVMVDNGTPTIDIEAPDGAAALYADIPVELRALVGDDRDTAEELEVLWQVDGGSLSVIGANVSSDGVASGSATLPAGVLVLSAQVTDSLGKQSTDTVTVEVFAENTLPGCSITAAPTEGAIGDTITFSGTATDDETAPTLLQTRLDSSRDGELTDDLSVATGGNWTFPTDALSGGTHVVTLTVTDDYGDVCVETVTVEICEDLWYTDTDGDGQGDPATAQGACAQPSGTVANAEDCDDSDPFTHQGAAERESSSDCMTDADEDGYGDSAAISPVVAGSDCDDAAAAVNTAATEVCDSIDNDCDGAVDDDDTSVDTSTGSTWYTDADTDGYGDASSPVMACAQPSGAVTDATDCDDAEAARNPGEVEVCDDLDNDCDSDVDEGVTTTFYADSDSDGFGDAAASVEDCSAPTGHVTDATDCDDGDVSTYPGAASSDSSTACMTDADSDGYGDDSPASGVTAGTDCDDSASAVNAAAAEVCDSIDNDCDGDTDDDDSGLDTSTATTWYADTDGDTYGDSSASQVLCTQPSDTVTDNTDCDDGDADTFPGAAATDSTTACMTDSDGDGYGDDSPASGVSAGTDCDDAALAVNTAATEVCDDIDNDCDGDTDDDDTGLDTTTASTWYADTDTDSYGDPSNTTAACDQPSGYLSDNTDCDDGDLYTYPGAAASDSSTACMTDSDGDGYGDDAPASGVTAGTDCDDAALAVHPAATEECDSIDNDCDGDIDDADTNLDTSTATTWYADSDTDGYGDASNTSLTCTQPSGTVTDNTDCDDTDGDTFPGAAATDSATACMTDGDGDGYGDDSPAAGVTAGTDCDDGASAVNPAATEECDSIDNDCDGDIDDADSSLDTSTATTWYADTDGDSYGDSASSQLLCTQPSNTVTDSTDCDDTDGGINPGATEICDADDTDEDCNGLADDADSGVSSATFTDWYTDSDGDDYGDSSASATSQCDAPTSAVADNSDCDDADGDVNPDALEVCDGVDNDCNGSTDVGLCGALTTSDADATYTGANSGDRFGSGIAVNGDLNGDGYPELIVGANTFDNTGTDDGAVYVYMGPATAGGGAGSADGTLVGTDADHFGAVVDAGGDLNGDGYDDMVLCEPRSDRGTTNAGAAWIVYGPVTGTFSSSVSSYADAVLLGDDSTDFACYRAGIIEDFTGDGLDELFVSIYFADNSSGGAAGEGLIINGSATTLSSSYGIYATGYDTRIEGTGTNEYVGNSMSEGGDVDGDGYGDLLMGGHGYSGKGAVGLEYGPVSGLGNVYITDLDVRFVGRGSGDNAGWRVSTGGDATGDGRTDILLSATTAYDAAGSTRGGAVYLFSDGSYAGDVSVNSYDAVIYGDASNDQLGHGLKLADVDGDGVADAVMGAPHVDSYTGAVYVLYGPLSGSYAAVTDADAVIEGQTAGPALGQTTVAGDLDQDGIDDIVTSDPSVSGSNPGHVYLFFGGLE